MTLRAHAMRHRRSFGSSHGGEQIRMPRKGAIGRSLKKQCVRVAQCFGLEGVFQQKELVLANLPMWLQRPGPVAWSAQP